MMTSFWRATVAGLASLSVLPVTASTLEDEVLLPAISVTATRAEEPVAQVPASIQRKGGDQIDLDAPSVQEGLFNSIPGVRVTQTGSTIGHMTSIRMPTNTGPYYLFLQDSIPVQSSGFFNHNGLAYTNYMSAGATEILKGAGTALYGSDAIAATINVLSVEPQQARGLTLRSDTGSDGFWRLSGQGGGILGEDGNLSANLVHQHSDGWREHTNNDRDELAVQHLWMPSDDTTLKTVFSYNRSVAEMAGSLIGRNALEHDRRSVGDIARTLDQGVGIERKFDFARLSTEWTDESRPGIRLNTIGYVRSNRNRYTATWQPSLPQNDSKTQTIGIMAKADIHSGKLHYIPGIDIEYTRDDEIYRQRFDFTPTKYGSPVAKGNIYDYQVDYHAIAPYLRIEYQPVPKVTIGGGLRYDLNGFDYTNRTDDGRYASSSFFRPADNNDPTFHHLSPKLDAAYQLTNDARIYARYANGFRIPQASRLYRLKTNNIGFSLDPETTDTFELGGKFRWLDQVADLAIYRMNIDDSIVRRENANKERFYVNAGRTIHYGLEAAFDSRWNDVLSSHIAYAYSQHRFDHDVKFGDNDQRSAPGTLANLRLSYTPLWLPGGLAMLEWEHVGSWWMDDKNSKKYEGYDIANLKMRYQATKNLSLYLRILNLTDEIYAERAEISFGKEKYTPGAPRQLFIGLKYRMY